MSELASHLQPVRGGHDLSPVKRSLPQPFGGVLRLGGRKPAKSRGQTWAISTRLGCRLTNPDGRVRFGREVQGFVDVGIQQRGRQSGLPVAEGSFLRGCP